jgi:ornithine cyclodeaminase/alanine dehydrogenase-like protein (mu-crystallin family)
MHDPATLRYLAGPMVRAALPALPDQLGLAERALRALAGRAELPPKIGVHPRPDASWAHAMPAFVPDRDGDPANDLLGIKWVSGFPANTALGLPAIHATLLLFDATTGEPRAALDAGPVTAARTAAISGVVIRSWGPANGSPTVALVGAGVQGESHLAILGEVLPGSRLRIHDRDQGRATALAERARRSESFADVTDAAHAADAVRGADVVITLVSFGPDRQAIPADAFRDARLVVAVDYDMCVPASVARGASLFLVDEAGQFLANRETGIFAGYPDPAGIIGAHLDDADRAGRVLVTHLGTGVADLVFGDAVLRAAEARDLGMLLPA